MDFRIKILLQSVQIQDPVLFCLNFQRKYLFHDVSHMFSMLNQNLGGECDMNKSILVTHYPSSPQNLSTEQYHFIIYIWDKIKHTLYHSRTVNVGLKFRQDLCCLFRILESLSCEELQLLSMSFNVFRNLGIHFVTSWSLRASSVPFIRTETYY